MPDRNLNQTWQALVAEHIAARQAFDVANSMVTKLTETAGTPIEHIEAEVRDESRARAELIDIRRRMDQFDVDREELLPIG